MRKIALFIAMLLSVVALHAQGDLHIYTVDNKDGKIAPKMLEDALAKNGFTIGINSDIHDGLSKMYKESSFKIYNAISIYHNEISMELLKEHADAGVFSPMGVTIYQGAKEDSIHISVLTAAAQAKILGHKAKALVKLEKAIATVITTLFPKATHSYSEDSLKESRDLITKYTQELHANDWEDAKDELEENFEDKFKEVGFVMPSYFDFSENFGKDSPYDFYVTYSICKIEVIKAVSEARPEAAAFAPCTTMVYKKKDEDRITMGFSSVYNWMSSAKIVDSASHDALMKAQTDFEGVLKDVTK